MHMNLHVYGILNASVPFPGRSKLISNEDKTLSFHTGYGAEILRLVPDFRPEDLQNQGTGVLIQYPGDLLKILKQKLN